MSDTPEGLQKQIDAATEFCRKWILLANVKKCAVVVCNDSKIEEVDFKWKSRSSQRWISTHDLGVKFSQDRMGGVHMKKVTEKEKARVSKLYPVLAYQPLDTVSQ